MKKFEMLNIITKDCELTAKEKLVAQYFVYKSNKEGACYPCVDKIAEECSVSRRTVQRATSKLVEKEYIIKEKRFKFGKQTSNLYSFNTLLLLEKEEDNSNFEQNMEIEVIELSALLEGQQDEFELVDEYPEVFIPEEEEGIDLDELVASSMEDTNEDEYVASMLADSILHNDEFSKEPGSLEPEEKDRKQGEISFSVIMYAVVFVIGKIRTNYGTREKLMQVTLATIEQQQCMASKKIMGAFFPP